jgi:hypothetical protein
MPATWLRLLKVTGADREAFLQGQLTQDVAALRAEHATPAGWADSKGRLLLVTSVFGDDVATWLTAPAETAADIVRRLRMFVLRARVEVAVSDEPLTVVMALPERELPLARLAAAGLHGVTLTPDRQRALVRGEPGSVSSQLGIRPAAADPEPWRLTGIRAGMPEILPATSGEFVPQMVNLDLIGGISFSKGCYVGQEIVARTRYLGRVKRRMLRFRGPGPAPAPGARLYSERGATGTVVIAARAGDGSELLAVMVLESMPGPWFLDEERTRRVELLDLPYRIPEL